MRAHRYTEESAGPLEPLVMCAARQLHDDERSGEDWLEFAGSTVTSYCRRAIEARGLEWKWIMEAIARECQLETTERR